MAGRSQALGKRGCQEQACQVAAPAPQAAPPTRGPLHTGLLVGEARSFPRCTLPRLLCCAVQMTPFDTQAIAKQCRTVGPFARAALDEEENQLLRNMMRRVETLAEIAAQVSSGCGWL